MSGQQQPQQPHGDHQVQPPLQQLPQQVYQQLHTSSSTAPGGQPVFDLGKFWMEEMHNVQAFDSDFKNHPLPLARIKKVMKTDQDVKMISAEAPILFAKGCEIFITELTKRAWVHAEENKRRTLQRSDIATAISKTDMCDFLIDIVPREEASRANNHVYDQNTSYAAATSSGTPANPYYQPQYAATTAAATVDAGNYYPQLSQFTADQVQQYQMQIQQYQMQQQQQQQQHSSYEGEQQSQQPKSEKIE